MRNSKSVTDAWQGWLSYPDNNQNPTTPGFKSRLGAKAPNSIRTLARRPQALHRPLSPSISAFALSFFSHPPPYQPYKPNSQRNTRLRKLGIVYAGSPSRCVLPSSGSVSSSPLYYSKVRGSIPKYSPTQQAALSEHQRLCSFFSSHLLPPSVLWLCALRFCYPCAAALLPVCSWQGGRTRTRVRPL